MVWNQRNKVRLNLAEQAKQKLVQFRADWQNTEVQVIDNNIGGSRWTSLQVGLVKIDFDGAVFSESNQSGIGVVI